jgi:DNA-directed RNA polymerase specialized sigma24 family protein
MPRGRWYVGFKSPEDELEEFLAPLPSWHRKILQLDYSLSPDEWSAWQQSDWLQAGGQVDDKYLELLKRCPEKWREYRKCKRKLALMDVPKALLGRPKTPAKELAEILALKDRGLNEDQIAKIRGLTKDTVRKRLDTAKRRIPLKP